jgi:hypothetical protein
MIEEQVTDKINDKNDETIRTIKEEKQLPYSELTGAILACCFDVMKELGLGFFGESL